MALSLVQNIAFEVDLARLRERVFAMIPGLLSWMTIMGLAILGFVLPFFVAIFVIAYNVYIFIRAMYMSVHLIYAYRRLRLFRNIDWLARCERQTHTAHDWRAVHHVVVIPTYNESLEVLRTTLGALRQTDWPKDKMHVVVGFEERVGETAKHRAKTLAREFAGSFRTLLTTFHPDGLLGEKRVKSANATWALQQWEAVQREQGIDTDDVLVSNFDSDTVVTPSYFSHLTYVFMTHPNRYRVSYQPIPVYNNNMWDVPAFSRVIATGSTFWQLIESTRPERLVTFSSHSMTLRALKDVGYWQKDIVSEDSRIFWQCLLRYDGHYRTEPLYTTVSMDAALSDTWWKTLVNQYKQKRRWAWGIENFPYLAEGFWRNPRISKWTKFVYTFRTLEGHFSWATAPIIVAGLGWIPIFFGGPEFHATVLSYSLPFVARTLMQVAMGGLLVSATISMLMMPQRPTRYSQWKYISIVLQWALVPLIATLLSAFPALDAETRLMLGRDLDFHVMEKARRQPKGPVTSNE